MRVPTTAATVIAASFSAPSPGVVKQTADVDDAHAAVRQFDRPRRVVGVVSSDPKSIPDTVTLYPAVVAALLSPTKLTTGAARSKHQANVSVLLAWSTNTATRTKGPHTPRQKRPS